MTTRRLGHFQFERICDVLANLARLLNKVRTQCLALYPNTPKTLRKSRFNLYASCKGLNKNLLLAFQKLLQGPSFSQPLSLSRLSPIPQANCFLSLLPSGFFNAVSGFLFYFVFFSINCFSVSSILKEVHKLSLEENVSAVFLHSWLFEAFSVCKPWGRQHTQTYCLEAEPFGDYACQKVVAGVKGRHSVLFELFGRSRLEGRKEKGPVCGTRQGCKFW